MGMSIALACDADLCALYPKIRKIRESMTIEKAIELFETNKPLTNERPLGRNFEGVNRDPNPD